MTKVEKWTLGMSAAALALSMLVPVASYYLLDPTMKQFQLRGKLVVRPTYSATYIPDVKSVGATDSALTLSIVNTGKLPAKDIQVAARFGAGVTQVVSPATAPQIPVDVDPRSTPLLTYLTLKRALAPGDSVQLRFTTVPEEVQCANEFGETTRVAANWSRIATGATAGVKR